MTTDLFPLLTQQQCVEAIAAHSAGFADAARDNLDADVECCPGWTVRDAVHHITEVHWIWALIVENHWTAKPADLEAPERAGDTRIIERFLDGAAHLVEVLGAADPNETVWTWAPDRQDAGFVVRHQVQEAVVHHWDVAQAAGRTVEIAPDVGADSVDEFLHYSVENDTIRDRFAVVCTDSDWSWTVPDLAAKPEPGIPAVTGTGGDLILWLYDRPSAADVSAVDPAVRQRFREASDTN